MNEFAEYLELGRKAGQKFDYENAIAYLTKAIQINQNAAEAYFIRGQVHAGHENHENAIDDLSTVISLEPNNAKAYFFRNESYYKIGEKTKAKDDFLQALEIDQKYSQYYNVRGGAALKNGFFLKALEEFSRSIELIGTNIDSLIGRAIVFGHLGEHEKALLDLKEAEKIDGNNPLIKQIQQTALEAINSKN